MNIDPLELRGAHFIDRSGREVLLRGVNLGGDCKVPYPNGGTHLPSDFADHRTVSFVGRPFPLDEADEHFARLKHWGFNVLRLLTTWEAIEHRGPGEYDTEYLEYYAEICRRAGKADLYVFVDFHQDVWSRMTGGCGAPGWTFEAVGLDFTTFHRADAAHVMQHKYDYAQGGRQTAYPQMSWPMNGRLAANGIMWNLFFAGSLLTPDFRIDGRNVQQFLQDAYLGCMREVARRVCHLPNVIGFDTLNEPSATWLGQRLTYRHLSASEDNPAQPRPGLALSPLDALLAARGVPVNVPKLVRDPQSGRALFGDEVMINAARVNIWRSGHECPFEAAGAYRLVGDHVQSMDEDFFRIRQGRHLNVSDHAFAPLFHAVSKTIREHNPKWALFAELDPYGAAAGRHFPQPMPERWVNASHWYDTATLHLKTFDPYDSWDFVSGVKDSSPDAVRERFVKQLRGRAELAARFPAGVPTLIGEFGIPFDLGEGAAYEAWARGERDESLWSKHIAALDLMYDALDRLLLHATQWNYTASNRNDLMIGDGWNQEDLSLYSRDQHTQGTGADSGGRAVRGFCRPYVQRAQGHLRSMRFSSAERRFDAVIDVTDCVDAPTLIYLPRIHFPNDVRCTTDGVPTRTSIDMSAQRIEVQALEPGRLRISLTA